MSFVLILQHDSGHGFDNRHNPGADAGVVTTLGNNIPLIAVNIPGPLLYGDARGRFNRGPEDDLLARRDAAENPAVRYCW